LINVLRHIDTPYELVNYIKGRCSIMKQIFAARERMQAHDR
jgi:hypothetical protein